MPLSFFLFFLFFPFQEVHGLTFQQNYTVVSNYTNEKQVYPYILPLGNNFLYIWNELISSNGNYRVVGRIDYNDTLGPIHYLTSADNFSSLIDEVIVLDNTTFVVSFQEFGDLYNTYEGGVFKVNKDVITSTHYFSSFYRYFTDSRSILYRQLSRINETSFLTGFRLKYQSEYQLVMDRFVLDGAIITQITYNLTDFQPDLTLYQIIGYETYAKIIWGRKKTFYHDLRVSDVVWGDNLTQGTIISNEIRPFYYAMERVENHTLLIFLEYQGSNIFQGTILNETNNPGLISEMTEIEYSTLRGSSLSIEDNKAVFVWKNDQEIYYRFFDLTLPSHQFFPETKDILVRDNPDSNNVINVHLRLPNFHLGISDQDTRILDYEFTPIPDPILPSPSNPTTGEKITSSSSISSLNVILFSVIIISVLSTIIALFLIGAVAIYWRHHLKKKSSIASAHEMATYDVASTLRLDGTRTTIKGRYQLIDKINRDEAKFLQEETGRCINFPPGINKIPYLVGEGNGGKVRLAYDMNTNKFITVKKIREVTKIIKAQQERDILNRLPHPNIIHLIDAVLSEDAQNNNVLYIFTPLLTMDGLMLKNLLFSPGSQDPISGVSIEGGFHRFAEPLILTFFYQVATGLVFMHDNSFYHRDVKLSNILVGVDGSVKLTDMGSACYSLNGFLEEAAGDIATFSPESMMLHRREVSSIRGDLADVWALGLTLVELTTGNPLLVPTIEWNPPQYAEYTSRISGLNYLFSNHYFYQLLEQMLMVDFTQRTNLHRVIEGLCFRETIDDKEIFQQLREIYEYYINLPRESEVNVTPVSSLDSSQGFYNTTSYEEIRNGGNPRENVYNTESYYSQELGAIVYQTEPYTEELPAVVYNTEK